MGTITINVEEDWAARTFAVVVLLERSIVDGVCTL